MGGRDDGGGGVDDVDGEEYRGVLYTVTQKGELKRWEKVLDAYVDKVQRVSMSARIEKWGCEVIVHA